MKFPPEADESLPACLVCGNAELYKKKNFPHWLGLTLLAAASLAFVVFQGLYLPRVAWGILIASAVIDGLLYLMVGDAVVCYRCGSQYSGFRRPVAQAPFELVVAERYRQEKARTAQKG